MVEGHDETIRVSIRIRPLSVAEKQLVAASGGCQLVHSSNEITILNKVALGRRSVHTTSEVSSSNNLFTVGAKKKGINPAAYASYSFDCILDPVHSAEDIHQLSGCQDIVSSVVEGCNGTLFVYGQTGAGKTFTIDQLTRLAVEQLFDRVQRDVDWQYQVSLGVLELYNETIRDLISGRDNLKLQMCRGDTGVLVEGLAMEVCSSASVMLALMEKAKANRVVGETMANTHSSRSHMILRVMIQGIKVSGGGKGQCSSRTSLLNLVDLAGSERVEKAGTALPNSMRFKEATHINKGLLCLGNVVTALGDISEGKKVHVPYRDSKLTRILQDSLGGTSRTALIACITSLPDWHLEQTRHTLDFAARTARVVCRPTSHTSVVAVEGNQQQVELLQREVDHLRQLLAKQKEETEALRRGSLLSVPVTPGFRPSLPPTHHHSSSVDLPTTFISTVSDDLELMPNSANTSVSGSRQDSPQPSPLGNGPRRGKLEKTASKLWALIKGHSKKLMPSTGHPRPGSLTGTTGGNRLLRRWVSLDVEVFRHHQHLDDHPCIGSAPGDITSPRGPSEGAQDPQKPLHYLKPSKLPRLDPTALQIPSQASLRTTGGPGEGVNKVDSPSPCQVSEPGGTGGPAESCQGPSTPAGAPFLSPTTPHAVAPSSPIPPSPSLLPLAPDELDHVVEQFKGPGPLTDELHQLWLGLCHDDREAVLTRVLEKLREVQQQLAAHTAEHSALEEAMEEVRTEKAALERSQEALMEALDQLNERRQAELSEWHQQLEVLEGGLRASKEEEGALRCQVEHLEEGLRWLTEQLQERDKQLARVHKQQGGVVIATSQQIADNPLVEALPLDSIQVVQSALAEVTASLAVMGALRAGTVVDVADDQAALIMSHLEVAQAGLEVVVREGSSWPHGRVDSMTSKRTSSSGLGKPSGPMAAFMNMLKEQVIALNKCIREKDTLLATAQSQIHQLAGKLSSVQLELQQWQQGRQLPGSCGDGKPQVTQKALNGAICVHVRHTSTEEVELGEEGDEEEEGEGVEEGSSLTDMQVEILDTWQQLCVPWSHRSMLVQRGLWWEEDGCRAELQVLEVVVEEVMKNVGLVDDMKAQMGAERVAVRDWLISDERVLQSWGCLSDKSDPTVLIDATLAKLWQPGDLGSVPLAAQLCSSALVGATSGIPPGLMTTRRFFQGPSWPEHRLLTTSMYRAIGQKIE